MEVTIRTEAAILRLDAEALDAAVFLANVFGYGLDLEPFGDHFTITATHFRYPNRLIAKGKSVKAVAKKLIDILVGEVKR